jgi:hypothetical protein
MDHTDSHNEPAASIPPWRDYCLLVDLIYAAGLNQTRVMEFLGVNTNFGLVHLTDKQKHRLWEALTAKTQGDWVAESQKHG